MAKSIGFLRVLSIWTSPSLTVVCSPTVCLVCSTVRSSEESWWGWYRERAEPNSQVGLFAMAHASLPQHSETSSTLVPSSRLHQQCQGCTSQQLRKEHSTAALSLQVTKASPEGSHKVQFQVWVHRYQNTPSALKWFANCTQRKVLVCLIWKYGRGKKNPTPKKAN